MQPPAAAGTLLDLALTGLCLPGGEATAAGLLEGLVCLSPPVWFGAALQTALAVRGSPDGQDAVLRMLQRLPVSALPAPVAVEAMSQVSNWRTERGLACWVFVSLIPYPGPLAANTLSVSLSCLQHMRCISCCPVFLCFAAPAGIHSSVAL